MSKLLDLSPNVSNGYLSGESLFNNIIKGHEQLSKIVNYFLGLCIMWGKATVDSWKEESTEPTWNEKTKQWESPYHLNMWKHIC